MGNDDFVRVPREPHPVAIQAIFDATKLVTLECIAAYRAVVSTAPPSAPSGDNVSTPSSHGLSPALRAQVIEECATIAEEWDSGGYGQHTNMVIAQKASLAIASVIRAIKDGPVTEAERHKLINDSQIDTPSAAAAGKSREWIDWDYVNSLGVDQLRQELAQAWSEAAALDMALRELPEVPPHMALRALFGPADGTHKSAGIELQRKHGLDAIPPKFEFEAAAGLWSMMRAGILASRLQPAAASEAPISAEAVNQSPDVAEMVERLTKYVTTYGEEFTPDDAEACSSLLSSLARERERLRADTKRLDFLDRLNASLNKRYNSNYRWELVLNHNVTRLMLGGHLVVDLNDAKAHGLKSCRDAIDKKIREAEIARSALPHPDTKGT